MAELSDKIRKKLDTTEATFKTAVDKADNARFYAVQKATVERVKALKLLQTEATKSGDLDGATEIKSRITAAETTGGARAKPKDTVKFGGHEYAIINENAPWHVARSLCEQMGGHLATMETPAEWDGVAEMCRKSGVTAWVGATDEVAEGKWLWLTGRPVESEFRAENAYDSEHCMVFWAPSGAFDDNGAGARHVFVCEWDK